jgi:hypothetical protein
MIKIFIESGVNAAKKHDKETTNEQDFIVKVIAKHFPNCQYKKDYDVIGTNGWTNIPNSEYEFKENTDNGFQNLVIFDADEDKNGGGFAKRLADILALKSDSIDFDLFLWPDNQSDGDFELLLSKIINPEHQCLLDCYENFEKEVRANDPEEIKYETPGRKGEMYSYISLQKMSQNQKGKLNKGYWQFDNPDYWDLSSDALKPLIEFLRQYLENQS